MDVLFDIFAPFNTALRPKVRTARADRQPQHKATTSRMTDRAQRSCQNSVHLTSSCASCSHAHAQGMTRRFNVITCDGFGTCDAGNLLGLITQTFGCRNLNQNGLVLDQLTQQ
jgi:ABC-type nickel/cobalt efflux system permease component RcnA